MSTHTTRVRANEQDARPGRSTTGRTRSAIRIAPVLWMAALALFIIAVGVLPAVGDPVPSGSTSTMAVRVSPSDTLWSIAAAHRLPGLSTAQMVDLIKQQNAMSGGALKAGAVLQVPGAQAPGVAYAQAGEPVVGH